MNSSPSSTTDVQPLLARFAVLRDAHAELPGEYSDNLRLWVIEAHGGKVPLIEADVPLLELSTKTKIEVEQDDMHDDSLIAGGDPDLGDRRGYRLALLTSTITEVKPEADDLE